MKRILCLLFSLITFVAFSQNAPTEVSLVVSADGTTKIEAVDNALRLAVEQTYGTFVSANTTILNDELVKDEIASVSSGNIQKYTEIACVTLPSGNTSVTLDVTVSITKLVSYAQSKGSQCEFAGATFGANKRLYDFNKANEIKAINNMIKQLDALRPVYDYEIKVSDPVINKDGKDAMVGIKVIVLSNEKTKIFNDIIKNTIMSLALKKGQIAPMEQSGFQYEKYVLFLGDQRFNSFYNDTRSPNPDMVYYLYTKKLDTLNCFLENALFDYAITDNCGNEYLTFNVYYQPRGFTGHNTHWSSTNKEGEWYNTIHNYGSNCFAINYSDTITWVFPTVNFDIPIYDVELIRNIIITPTKNNATNYLLSKAVYDYNTHKYHYPLGCTDRGFAYLHYPYFYSKSKSSQDINKAIEIYRTARLKYIGSIDTETIKNDLLKLKNK